MPFLLLPGRLILFLVVQALIAFLASSWEFSQKYWLLTATLTNIICIVLLIIIYRKEGNNYFSIFRFSKKSIKKDILIFSGLAVLSILLATVPAQLLSYMLWDDPDVPTSLLFAPIEDWLAYLLLISFPLTIALAELGLYFKYIMPKLLIQLKYKWLAVMLPAVFLSLQHITLPYIPDFNFILYRSIVFFPFALLIGLSLYYRPSLFVYFAILHGILDLGTVLMIFINK